MKPFSNKPKPTTESNLNEIGGIRFDFIMFDKQGNQIPRSVAYNLNKLDMTRAHNNFMKNIVPRAFELNTIPNLHLVKIMYNDLHIGTATPAKSNFEKGPDYNKLPISEAKSNPEIDKLLKIMSTKKAGPEYKKALMSLIAMAEKKSGKTVNTKKEALLALDYTEPSIKEVNLNASKLFKPKALQNMHEAMNKALYKDWDQFEHPSKIKVYLNTGKTLEITPLKVKGGKKVYDAILQAFIDDKFTITNAIIQHMDKSTIKEVNLNQSKLSPSQYQQAKKLKAFNATDWKWDSTQDLYIKSANTKTIKLDSFSASDSDKISDFLNSNKIPFKKLGSIFTISLSRTDMGAATIKNKLKSLAKFDEVNESVKSASELIENIVSQTILEAYEPVQFDPNLHMTPDRGAIDFELNKDMVIVYMPFKEETESAVAVPVKKIYFDDMLDDGYVESQEDLDDLDYSKLHRNIHDLFRRPDLFKKYVVVNTVSKNNNLK